MVELWENWLRILLYYLCPNLGPIIFNHKCELFRGFWVQFIALSTNPLVYALSLNSSDEKYCDLLHYIINHNETVDRPISNDISNLVMPTLSLAFTHIHTQTHTPTCKHILTHPHINDTHNSYAQFVLAWQQMTLLMS